MSLALASSLHPGEHESEVCVHGGVLYDDVSWRLDAEGGEVPDRLDARSHEAVGHELCLQDGDGEDGNLDLLGLDAGG